MEARGHYDAIGYTRIKLWANRIDEVFELIEWLHRVRYVRVGEEVQGELIHTHQAFLSIVSTVSTFSAYSTVWTSVVTWERIPFADVADARGKSIEAMVVRAKVVTCRQEEIRLQHYHSSFLLLYLMFWAISRFIF